jgi:hypothetical protein
VHRQSTQNLATRSLTILIAAGCGKTDLSCRPPLGLGIQGPGGAGRPGGSIIPRVRGNRDCHAPLISGAAEDRVVPTNITGGPKQRAPSVGGADQGHVNSADDSLEDQGRTEEPLFLDGFVSVFRDVQPRQCGRSRR